MTLDLTASRDRRGLWTYRHYNENRQMDSITDPANRTTFYSWCDCGSLDSITDAEQRTTMFFRDLQGRLRRKQYPDHTGINYLYEDQTPTNPVGANSRVASMTDAKGQRTNYRYFKDDNVAEVSYTDTNGAPLYPVTPTVSYLYDENYNRLKSMDDGTGRTTYTYYPIPAPVRASAPAGWRQSTGRWPRLLFLTISSGASRARPSMAWERR